MSVAVLDNYRGRIADLPQDRFLGSVLWFSVGGTRDVGDGRLRVPVRTTHDQLETWFDELGLNKDFLPAKIKKIDAFRKASSEVGERWSKRRKYETPDGKVVSLRVVEIDNTDEFVLRHVMRDVTDPRSQNTTSAQLASLKFFKGDPANKGRNAHYKYLIVKRLTEFSIETNRPTGQTYAVDALDQTKVEEMIADFETLYVDLSANLHAQAIRAMIRNYVVHLNAISVKPSGGVYFVHTTRQELIDKLQELVRRIGQGCSFHQLPLVDTDEQRGMLTEAFEDEVEDEAKKLTEAMALVNEAARANAGAAVDPTKWAELNVRLRALTDRSEEYTNLLGQAQDRAATALTTCWDLLIEMSTRLDNKPTTPRRGRPRSK